jgi:hypothetical protein
MLSVVMLSVVMLSVVMLSVVMLSVVMLSIVMLSVVMLSVVMLNVIMVGVVCWVFVSQTNICGEWNTKGAQVFLSFSLLLCLWNVCQIFVLAQFHI